jgi:hypothetical protein
MICSRIALYRRTGQACIICGHLARSGQILISTGAMKEGNELVLTYCLYPGGFVDIPAIVHF